jgi:hypothetical protein
VDGARADGAARVLKASDVFAFGVLLFEIFAREAPWKGVTNIVAATKVMAGERMDVSSRKIPSG